MSEATDQIASDAFDAATGEADERGWGTSQEDVNAYAAAAGAVAGAAACSAVGAAAAAPLCAWLAGEAAAWLSDTIGGWFYSDEEAQAAEQRREDVRRHFAGMLQAVQYDELLGGAFQRAVADLGRLHAELWPGEAWEGLDPHHPQADYQQAMLLLELNGLPLEHTTGDYVLLGVPSVRAYWGELDAQGIDTARKQTMVAARAQALSTLLEHAYNASVLQLSTQKAAELSVAQLEGRERTSAIVGAKYTGSDVPAGITSEFAERYTSGATERREQTAHAQVMPARRFIPYERRSWSRGVSQMALVMGLAGLGCLPLPWSPMRWLSRRVPG